MEANSLYIYCRGCRSAAPMLDEALLSCEGDVDPRKLVFPIRALKNVVPMKLLYTPTPLRRFLVATTRLLFCSFIISTAECECVPAIFSAKCDTIEPKGAVVRVLGIPEDEIKKLSIFITELREDSKKKERPTRYIKFVITIKVKSIKNIEYKKISIFSPLL